MKKSETILLGIEAGGTKTIAIAANSSLKQLARVELGPANLRILSDRELLALFRELKRTVAAPNAIGIGLPGLRTKADAARVAGLLGRVWPKTPARVTHDLALALHAMELHEPATKHLPKVVVLSGTGSCCYGRGTNGREEKAGGWGHLLGDKGSGYDIALQACRAAVFYFDRDGEWTALGENILRELALNEPNDLINWIQSAGKKEIAALAIPVFAAWKKGDRHASEVIEAAAHSLATDAVKCAARLENSDATVQFILAGSVLLKQPRFAELVGDSIRKKWPQAVVTPLAKEAAWGGVYLALKGGGAGAPLKAEARSAKVKAAMLAALQIGLEGSPTEMRNKRSMKLDTLSNFDAIELFLDEERFVQRGLKKIAPQIERAVGMVVAALKGGGRLFYVGAGTSGRLGVLDASECPPTFRTDPELVQGIIAGGQKALWSAVEGAEDDPAAGARAIAGRGVRARDVVVGIAASGRTPFVWGALEEAKRRRAKIILLTLNPKVALPKSPKLDVLLAADVGPELLTGSTRLKAGTATKLVLNMLTTIAMVRLGKVVSNLMIDLNPSNVKLRDRAIRIVQEVTGVERARAEGALEKANWVVKDALKIAGRA